MFCLAKRFWFFGKKILDGERQLAKNLEPYSSFCPKAQFSTHSRAPARNFLLKKKSILIRLLAWPLPFDALSLSLSLSFSYSPSTSLITSPQSRLVHVSTASALKLKRLWVEFFNTTIFCWRVKISASVTRAAAALVASSQLRYNFCQLYKAKEQ